MRVHLRVQQLDFRLRQQRFLPLVLPGQNLRRQQLRDTFSERAVDRAEQPVFSFVQLNGADDPLVFAAQRDHQRRTQFAVGVNGTAVRHFVAIGVHHLTGLNGFLRVARRDRLARQMMVFADAGKGEQFFPVGDRHRADVQLLNQHLRHLHAVFFIKALAQNPLCRGGKLQGGGRKRRGIFLKHRPLIQQDAHKQGRADRVGHHHRRGDALHQMQRVFKRARNQQNNQHLHQLGDKGNGPRRPRTEDLIRAATANQDAVHQAAQQPFHHGGDHTAERGHPAH